jgi:DNA-binding Lrp family transcriptional regulator
MVLDAIDQKLMDGWQKGFPLAPRPYAAIGAALGLGEDAIIERLRRLVVDGAVSRVGAVVRPNRAGASTLAALAVPPERLESVAAIVNAEPGVNHNYEREHAFNLWFVVTGRDRCAVDGALTRIEAKTGLSVLDLPLLRAFHIDLGFPVFGTAAGGQRLPSTAPDDGAPAVTEADRSLLAAIETGLRLTPQPFEAVAAVLDRPQATVLADLQRLVDQGVIARFGLVLRHRRLGFTANAMAVWDIPDEHIDAVAARFAERPFVTLCYERPRRGAPWPYNLFCMIHGRDRSGVEDQIACLVRDAGDRVRARAVLFSRRCFRQRGAVLSAA